MTHSINYYIQLSDDISEIVDGMTKLSLLDLANQCTHLCVDTIRQKYDFLHPLDSDSVWDELVEINIYDNLYLLLTVKETKQFAHGLLAKAI